jgi:hypothetical protein
VFCKHINEVHMKQFQKLAINKHGDSPRLLDYKRFNE